MPNVSIGRLHQLEQIEKEMLQRRESEALRPFVDEMLELIGITLAMTPYKDWPSFAKSAFEHMHSKNQMLGNAYLARLRK